MISSSGAILGAFGHCYLHMLNPNTKNITALMFIACFLFSTILHSDSGHIVELRAKFTVWFLVIPENGITHLVNYGLNEFIKIKTHLNVQKLHQDLSLNINFPDSHEEKLKITEVKYHQTLPFYYEFESSQ